MSRAHPRSAVLAALLLASLLQERPALAQPPPPSMTDPKLVVASVVEGLETPISLAFLGRDDFLVLEKNTGRVVRVKDGAVRGPVLDLAVNFGSERGLLGIALHPDFPSNRGVYLFWTCRTLSAPADPNIPDQTACAGAPALGADTDDLLQVPLLGNRVDRFHWNGSALVWEKNLITLRAFQADGAPNPPNQGDQEQPVRGNHDGGVLRFGPDGKLYILFGDQGRRGQLQNLPSGPTLTGLGPIVPDDQFGGPRPDDAHFAGVILRLDDDGDIPRDNPFFAAGKDIGGSVGENLQRVFAYGLRNSFGMAFDPKSGALWAEENGEDAFDEINRVEPGMNGGWIQIMGPLSRIAEYRAIETTSTHGGDTPGPNLQQLRWGPERIAQTADEARARLFRLPGSSYSDPEFSWKHVIAPAAIGFASGRGLGPEFDGDLFVGLSVPVPEGGPLLRLNLTGNRRQIAVDDPRLEDRVADNVNFNDLTESESLLIGRNFGVVTDIQTGPNGNLYVVSLSNGAVYKVSGTQVSRRGDDDDDDGDRDPDKKKGSHKSKGKGKHKKHGKQDDDAQLGGLTAGGGTALAPVTALFVHPTAAGGHAIRFVLGAPQRVRITVHDVTGRTVSEIVDAEAATGEHEVQWSSAAMASGVYFVRLEAVQSGGVRNVKTAKAIVVD